MTYRTIKWTLFGALFAVAPAVLFLVQAILFMPAIFFLAGIVYVIPKAFGNPGESLAFIAFLAVSALLHAGLFYLVAVGLAKPISWLPWRGARLAAVGVVCAALLGLGLSPVYGGGGHGPMRMTTLPQALAEIDRGYGPATLWIVYGTAAVLVGGILLVRRRR